MSAEILSDKVYNHINKIFTDSVKKWRDDGKCGASNPLPSGDASECDPSSSTPCCSDGGVCGGEDEHCHCSTCINYLKGSSCFISFLMKEADHVKIAPRQNANVGLG